MFRSTGLSVEGGEGGGGADANPFRDIKHPEQTEQRFGIGVMRYGEGQYGRRGFPGEKLTGGIYTCGLSMYRVVAMFEPSRHRGGIALLYWYYPILRSR